MTMREDRGEGLDDLAITLRPPDWRPVYRAVLSGEGLRAVAVIVGGIVLLVLPRSPRLYVVVIAAVMVVWVLGQVAESRATGNRLQPTRVLLAVAGAVLLVLWPSPSLTVIGRVVGSGLVVVGGVRITGVLRGGRDDRYVDVARHALTLSVGVATFVVPAVLLDFTVAVVGISWIVVGMARIVRMTSSTSCEPGQLETGGRTVQRWLLARSQAPQDRATLFEMLFFEGVEFRTRMGRFLVLMAFSTTIAALGVAVDSTAVVIGAMLIAPLMTPLMATSLSITMGWPRRSLVSVLVALVGVVVAIGLSGLIGVSIPYDIPVSNPQIASRITPTLTDLFIALAAGGAGAFALSRRDVSDALPGVAVAIALVPPLAVVGLMLQAGEAGAAFGAVLLFTTNLVAILLAGALVFVLTGVVPLERLGSNARWIRSTLALVAAAAVVVVVPLTVSGDRILAEAFDRQTAQEAVEGWIGRSQNEIRDLSVRPDAVFVRLAGPVEPPDVSMLADDLEQGLGRTVRVEVRWSQELTFVEDGTVAE